MTINDDGSLTIVDFFMPWEKTQLDGADRDLGTTPLELLPSEFSCGDIKRIGVVTGKSGKTYWLNLDNLGGYQNGPNKLDDIIQVYQNENSVYAGAGVYPLEGVTSISTLSSILPTSSSSLAPTEFHPSPRSPTVPRRMLTFSVLVMEQQLLSMAKLELDLSGLAMLMDKTCESTKPFPKMV